ncbi:Crp/Fnr family transcriptional regulator [bacterium]|nr:Crp/Fnr family transcriptional regulator [bacterium]MBU1958159.1 Crp/Fnr family transcriptional regulator [bacterium]
MKETLPINIPSTIEQDIEQHGKVIEFDKGAILFSPEELLDKFFVVFKGRIKVSQIELGKGKEQTLKILTTGDMYDVVSLLDGEMHDNLLTALDDVQVMSFPMPIVRSWLHSNNGFNQLLFPYIARQMREIEELAIDLSFYSTSQRLIKLIVKNVDPQTPNKLKLIYDLPHEEIASLIGTVRKVINRHIQELKKANIIEVDRKNIRLRNRHELLERLNK